MGCSSYLVVEERLVFRTDTREHTIGHNRRALRRILVLRCVDSTSGRLARRPAVVWRRCRSRTGLLVVTSRSLRRPVIISSPSACFRYFVAFSVKRRVYHLTVDDDVRRRRTTRFRAAAALRYRSSLPLFVTASNCYSRFSLLFGEALVIFGCKLILVRVLLVIMPWTLAYVYYCYCGR